MHKCFILAVLSKLAAKLSNIPEMFGIVSIFQFFGLLAKYFCSGN
jgi:hypothetical protein